MIPLLVLLALGVAGCAAAPPPTAPAAWAAPPAVPSAPTAAPAPPAESPEPLPLVARVFSVIEAGYVEVPDFGRLQVEGLQALGRFTPGGSWDLHRAQDTSGGVTVIYRERDGRAGRLVFPPGAGRDDAVRHLGAAVALVRRIGQAPSTAEAEQAIVRQVVAALDGRSTWLAPVEYQHLQAGTGGTASVGLQVTRRDGRLVVVTPVPGSPAERAGLQRGDRIDAIDGLPTTDMSPDQALGRLHGNPGSRVRLAVARRDRAASSDVELTREPIQTGTVFPRALGSGVGYVRLIAFREDTGRDVRAALDELIRTGIDAVVLDLRNNPGGLLSAGIDVAEMWLPDRSLITSTVGRSRSQNMRFLAHAVPGGGRVAPLPLVVLVNRETAGSAEIVAAAVQDHRRGVLVGTPTAGLGTIRTIVPLPDGSALSLTTAQYFRPGGASLSAGVTPDIAVEAVGDPGRMPDPQLERALDAVRATRR